MKALTYLRVAEIELMEAAQYYEAQRSGLGRMFLEAIQETEKRIQVSPTTWPVHHGLLRSCRVKPFPYRAYYRELPDHVQIVAVAHLSREPGYWKDRLT